MTHYGQLIGVCPVAQKCGFDDNVNDHFNIGKKSKPMDIYIYIYVYIYICIYIYVCVYIYIYTYGIQFLETCIARRLVGQQVNEGGCWSPHWGSSFWGFQPEDLDMHFCTETFADPSGAQRLQRLQRLRDHGSVKIPQLRIFGKQKGWQRWNFSLKMSLYTIYEVHCCSLWYFDCSGTLLILHPCRLQCWRGRGLHRPSHVAAMAVRWDSLHKDDQWSRPINDYHRIP